jgi:hypothetical protein
MRGLSRSKWSTTSTSNHSSSNRSIEITDPIDHQTGHLTRSNSDIERYDSRYGVDPIHRQLVRGYTELVSDRIETGWSC